jgi:CBS domain-containing protein
MPTVKKLLDAKENHENISVESDQTVLDALKAMKQAHIGAVLVTEKEKIVGIYTERDYLYKGELENRAAKNTRIKDVMTKDMMTVTKDTTVEQCMALMKQYRIRHLPVLEAGALVGLVSMRDVMMEALEIKQSEIRGLENYIMGTGFQS